MRGGGGGGGWWRGEKMRRINDFHDAWLYLKFSIYSCRVLQTACHISYCGFTSIYLVF